MKTEKELYEEFFKWLDGLAIIRIPAIGDLPQKTMTLSDILCDGATAHYADELFDAWKPENYEYVEGWVAKETSGEESK